MGQGGRENRLNWIFNQLEKGVPVAKINEQRDKMVERKTRQVEKGEDSELNAKRAINTLWYVREAVRISKDRNHDKNAHDLEVFLDELGCIQLMPSGLAIPNRRVFVQVKSSDHGIEQFKVQTMRYFLETTNESDYLKYLHDRKIIMINGQMPDASIQDDFQSQLIEMNNTYLSLRR